MTVSYKDIIQSIVSGNAPVILEQETMEYIESQIFKDVLDVVFEQPRKADIRPLRKYIEWE